MALTSKSSSVPLFLEVGDITERGAHPVKCGGYGDVWRAKRRGMDVALKTLRPHTYKDPEAMHVVREFFFLRTLRWPRC